MASRRAAVEGRAFSFDHGAQYFPVRDAGFAAQVRRWEAAGAAGRWTGAGSDWWVGTPTMSAPVRALAEAADVRWATRIDALVRRDEGWHLAGTKEGGGFDAVVVATPAEQAVALLAAHAPAFAAAAALSRSDPCWTAMAAFGSALDGVPGVIRDAGSIGWAARDSAKPGREGPEAWVIQASPDWSRAHLEDDPASVALDLLALFARHAGATLPEPVTLTAHRWRYARSTPGPHPGEALWSRSLGIGVCGDWLVAPRVEGAWLSGRRLADRMIADAGSIGAVSA